jgi:ABC-type transport system substrate-binding protein
LIGPEYPAWKDFYNLANEPQYSYNVTLAQKYLSQANITKMPMLTFPVLSGCDFCIHAAEVIQNDLSQVGVSVDIQVTTSSGLFPLLFNPYVFENASLMPNLAELGIPTWAPAALTPADNWINLVSNMSVGGNFAAYSNPVVNTCASSFTTTTNTSQIQSFCKQAQIQLYNDAPVAWFGGLKLWLGAGSLVWQKNVINGLYADPMWTGADTAPLFNTVTFVGQ